MTANDIIGDARVARVRELKAELAAAKMRLQEVECERDALLAHFDLALVALRDFEQIGPEGRLRIVDGWNVLLRGRNVSKLTSEDISKLKATYLADLGIEQPGRSTTSGLHSLPLTPPANCQPSTANGQDGRSPNAAIVSGDITGRTGFQPVQGVNGQDGRSPSGDKQNLSTVNCQPSTANGQDGRSPSGDRQNLSTVNCQPSTANGQDGRSPSGDRQNLSTVNCHLSSVLTCWIIFDGSEENTYRSGAYRVTYTGGTGPHRADRVILDYVHAAKLLGLDTSRLIVETADKTLAKKVAGFGADIVAPITEEAAIPRQSAGRTTPSSEIVTTCHVARPRQLGRADSPLPIPRIEPS